MPQKPPRIPSYRHHKARDLAVVTINGKDHYLGTYNTQASRQKYDRLIQEWLASGRAMTSETPVEPDSFSIAELIVSYLEHARTVYSKDGKPTSHLHNVEDAMSYLKNLYRVHGSRVHRQTAHQVVAKSQSQEWSQITVARVAPADSTA